MVDNLPEQLKGVDEKLIHHYFKDYIKEDELVRCIKRGQLSYTQARMMQSMKHNPTNNTIKE